MKSNKLMLAALASSLSLNILFLFSGSDKPDSALLEPDTAGMYQEFNNDDNDALFTQDTISLDLVRENTKADEIQVLKNKIQILTKYNKAIQSQIEQADQKQQAIIFALDIIVDKIDSQFLMPQLAVSDSNNEDSKYGLNFNAIPRKVVKQCMQLTSEASANIRQQQRQSREQLLQTEEQDDGWANEVENQINSVLANQQLQESELVDLNCRTTICQIKIQHNSAAAKKLFEGPFFTSFKQNVSQYDESFDKETNLSTGIFYLTRSPEN